MEECCRVGKEEKKKVFFFLSFDFILFHFILFCAHRGVWWGGRWGEAKDMKLYRTPVLSFSAAHGCCVYTHIYTHTQYTHTHTHTYTYTHIYVCVLYIYAWPGHDDFQGTQGAPLWGPSPPQRETHRRNMAATKWSSPAVSIDFGTASHAARMRCKNREREKKKRRFQWERTP